MPTVKVGLPPPPVSMAMAECRRADWGDAAECTLFSKTASCPKLVGCLSVLQNPTWFCGDWEPKVETHFYLQGIEQALTVTGGHLQAFYEIFASWDFSRAQGGHRGVWACASPASPSAQMLTSHVSRSACEWSTGAGIWVPHPPQRSWQ